MTNRNTTIGNAAAGHTTHARYTSPTRRYSSNAQAFRNNSLAVGLLALLHEQAINSNAQREELAKAGIRPIKRIRVH